MEWSYESTVILLLSKFEVYSLSIVKEFLLKSPKIKISCVTLFLVAIICAFFLGGYRERAKYGEFLKSFRNVRENSDKYQFINPLIGGISNPSTDVGIYSDVKDDILKFLKKEQKEGRLFGYSFYFRDMNTGLWFGDHETTAFFPASLFKLPIAIAVYKQAESDSSFLGKRYQYTEELSALNQAKTTNAASRLVVGEYYDVKFLVEIMLSESDNGAKNILLYNMDKRYLDQLLELVAFSNGENNDLYEISSRKYANFIRILYGSSYLDEVHSEHLLSILSKSDFKDGIVAGVPGNTKVAHKFGVYEFYEKMKGSDVLTVQLHDCGLIYHPQKPYTFCLMTKGKDDQSLFNVISAVSKMMYDHQTEHAQGAYY